MKLFIFLVFVSGSLRISVASSNHKNDQNYKLPIRHKSKSVELSKETYILFIQNIDRSSITRKRRRVVSISQDTYYNNCISTSSCRSSCGCCYFFSIYGIICFNITRVGGFGSIFTTKMYIFDLKTIFCRSRLQRPLKYICKS
jgi:hypothetical protein